MRLVGCAVTVILLVTTAPGFSQIPDLKGSRALPSPRWPTSLGNGPEPWGWTISTNLAPVFSPDHGKVPNDQRTWVKREASIFTGTAPTLEEGLADFKERWPKFRDARAHWRVFLCAVPTRRPCAMT
jgi:hypothetical protein